MIGAMKDQGWKAALRPLSLGGAAGIAPGNGSKNGAQQETDAPQDEDPKTASPASPEAVSATEGAQPRAYPAAGQQQQQPGRPPRRTLAEDWASLLLALRAPVVWSGAVWRMFYCTCLNGWVAGVAGWTGVQAAGVRFLLHAWGGQPAVEAGCSAALVFKPPNQASLLARCCTQPCIADTISCCMRCTDVCGLGLCCIPTACRIHSLPLFPLL